MPDNRPVMFLIAGPNGAGKTTFYESVLKPIRPEPFINADHIQKSELKNQSMESAYDAAKIAAGKRAEHLQARAGFVTESTFSHPSKLDLIDAAKTAGFRVVVYHVNVRSPNLSVARVASRVEEGGHPVPEKKIRARYARNQALIREAVLRADRGFVMDNSALNKPPRMALEFIGGRLVRTAEHIPAWTRELYVNALNHFSFTQQNRAAASYQSVKKQSRELAGESASVRLPMEVGREYRGKIVGESELHVLQHAEEGHTFVAHFSFALQSRPIIGQDVTITYHSRTHAVMTLHESVSASKHRRQSKKPTTRSRKKPTKESGADR